MGTATSLYPVGSSKTSSDIPADLAKPGQRYRLRVILALLPLFLFLFIYIAILAGSIAVLYYAVTFPAPQLGHSDNLARCLTVGIRIGLLTFSVMLSAFNVNRGLIRATTEEFAYWTRVGESVELD